MEREDNQIMVRKLAVISLAGLLISASALAYGVLNWASGNVKTAIARQQGLAGKGPVEQAEIGSATLRSPSDRLSDVINVRDYGAKCDGVSDDTTAINLAVTLALGVRARSNGGATIEIPAGRCMISGAIIVNLKVNSAIAIRGAGMHTTEIVQTSGTDGFVFNVPAGGVAARTAANPGAAITLRYLSIVQTSPGGSAVGHGVAVVGPSPSETSRLSSVPSLIEQVDFRGQWLTDSYGRVRNPAQGWRSDIFLKDVQNVIIKDGFITHYDYGEGAEKDVLIISTSPANKFSGNATGTIQILNEFIVGGQYGYSIEGNNIQGVSITSGGITAVAHGVHWDCSTCGVGFNGPLAVIDTGMSVTTDGVWTSNVGSVQVTGNQIIDGQPVAGVNWFGISLAATYASIVTNNIMINLPNISTLKSGHVGVGINIYNVQGAYRSIVSNNMIGPTDFGMALTGPVGASANLISTVPTIPEKCYLDQTGGTGLVRPTVTANLCGNLLSDITPNAPYMHSGETLFIGDTTIKGMFMETGQSSFAGRITASNGVLDTSISLTSRLASGFSVELPATGTGIILNCNGTLASGTLKLPASPVNDQFLHISSECNVKALTLMAPASGTAIAGASMSIAPATPLAFIYDATNKIWTRW